MDRVHQSGAAVSAPATPGSFSTGYPTAGSPAGGIPATKPGPWWYHMITEEIRKVIVDAGLTPSGTDLTQLSAAIAALIAAGHSGAPAGYLYGMALANNGGAPNTTIDIAAGIARNSANTYDMVLGAALSKILQAAGSWTAGTDNNGLFSGARANSTWYHVFAIRKDADGTIDAGFDTSVSAANRPAGYTAYRRLGSVRTDGSGNILAFKQSGYDFIWASPQIDIGVTNLGASSTTYTLGGVPTGVRVMADLFVYGGGGASSSGNIYVRGTDQTDLAPPAVAGVPSAAPATINQIYGTGDIADVASGTHCRILTDTSAQIAARASNANAWLYVHTRGYRDYL